MDGMDTPRGLINRIRAFLNLAPIPVPRFRYLMMGATNQWQALDPALLRDGRFGTQVHVDYPSFEGRIATLKGYLDKIDHSVDEDQIIRVARSMHRASGASIEGAVNEAVLSVFRDPDRTDRVVTSDDLVRAMLWKSHGEPEGTQEMDEDNYRVAIHEAGHAIVLHVLYSGYSRILFGSIEGRRGNQGMIAHTEVAKRPIQPRSVMESRVAVGLASMVAEELVFGESTNGMGGDLRAATSLARQMVLTSGMGETLQVYATNGDEAHRFDQQVEEVLKGAKKLAHDVLIERRDQLEAVAQLLIAKGTVLGAEIEEVLT
jgi:ATP-dependent Zn protease